jgi:hypothetical protein
MPSPTIPKPDASKLYTCLMSHTSELTGTFREGDRLRGDHPDVKRVPQLWIVDGTPTDEIHEARQARFPGAR